MNSQYTLEALYPKDEDSMPVICQVTDELKDERRLSPFLPLEEMVANYPAMPDARKDAMKI